MRSDQLPKKITNDEHFQTICSKNLEQGESESISWWLRES